MIHINWWALVRVAEFAILASVVFVVLLAFGVRFVSAAKVNQNQGRNGTAVLSAGYACLGVAGLLVLFCLYLIVPQFH